MINKNIQKLIEESGFVLWEDEPWGPGKGNIDWSNDYTEEMETFVKSLISLIIEDVKCYSSANVDSSVQWVETEGDIGYNEAIDHVVDHIKRKFL